MSNPKMEPCVCGDRAAIVLMCSGYRVSCYSNCGHKGDVFHSRQEAIDDWNSRCAPVPPAGDVEVLAWVDRDGDFYKERCYPDMKAVILLSDHRAVVTRLTAENDAIRLQAGGMQMTIDELTAERDRVQGDKDRAEAMLKRSVMVEDFQALQSELTKAREAITKIAMWPDGGNAYGQGKIKAFANRILSGTELDKATEISYRSGTPIAQKADDSCGQDAEAAKPVFNDPLYNAESDARNAAAMLEEVLEFYDDGVGRSAEEFKLMRKIGDWLGRSVPEIEHGSDDCAHSEANNIGCPECGEEFK